MNTFCSCFTHTLCYLAKSAEDSVLSVNNRGYKLKYVVGTIYTDTLPF